MNLTNIKFLNWGGIQLKRLLFDGEFVWGAPAIIMEQQITIACHIGDRVTLRVSAMNATSYTWQYSNDKGGTWAELYWTGYNTNTMTGEMTVPRSKFLYRCVIVGEDGAKVVTETISIVLVSKVVITQQPTDAVGAVGDTVSFTVQAENVASYHWQYSNSSGTNWAYLYNWADADISNTELTATLTGKMNSARVNFWYRCELTDEDGAYTYTDAVKVIEPIKIITQPMDVTLAVGETIIFHVEAEGEGLTYQWEYSINGGNSWMDNTMNGNQTDTLSWAAKAYQNGYIYRCLITDANGHTLRTNEVTLTVN